MYDQPKYKPLAASEFFPDGQAARPAVPGAVAQSGGSRAEASSGRVGTLAIPWQLGPVYPLDAQGNVMTSLPLDEQSAPVQNPLPYTREVLARGRERYGIYCAPCHSVAGDGEGMIVQRGFPHPPSYHSERLRRAPDEYFYKVITHGYGAMFSYAERVLPADRWAIVTYIRALQLSQHAVLADLPDTVRRKFEEVDQ